MGSENSKKRAKSPEIYFKASSLPKSLGCLVRDVGSPKVLTVFNFFSQTEHMRISGSFSVAGPSAITSPSSANRHGQKTEFSRSSFFFLKKCLVFVSARNFSHKTECFLLLHCLPNHTRHQQEHKLVQQQEQANATQSSARTPARTTTTTTRTPARKSSKDSNKNNNNDDKNNS